MASKQSWEKNLNIKNIEYVLKEIVTRWGWLYDFVFAIELKRWGKISIFFNKL